MDLRGIANQVSVVVNDNTPLKLKVSTGFTLGTGRKQIPTYASPLDGFGQIQALDGSDLKHLEGMNIQGEIRSIYIRGKLAGVIRPDQTGGDLISVTSGVHRGVWLIAKVFESWPFHTKAAIVRQMDTVF